MRIDPEPTIITEEEVIEPGSNIIGETKISQELFIEEAQDQIPKEQPKEIGVGIEITSNFESTNPIYLSAPTLASAQYLHLKISQKLNISNELNKNMANSLKRDEEIFAENYVIVKEFHALEVGPSKIMKSNGPNAYWWGHQDQEQALRTHLDHRIRRI